MVYVYILYLVYNTSLSFQLMAYGSGHPYLTVHIQGIEKASPQGEYYKKEYTSAYG